MKKQVVILQHRLLHYREVFFQKLKIKCDENNIDLHLVHGEASPRERVRKDEGFIDWADRVKNSFWCVANRDLLWQPLPKELLKSDLIVLMQENRIISNYPILIFRGFLPGKLAYWGHGVNFQSRSPNGLRERLKKYFLNKVDWWFAYTKTTSDLLVDSAFPAQQITCLNNAIDTSGFKKQYLSIKDNEVDQLRSELNMSKETKVGIFCGSLYKDKKLDLLLSSAELVRQKIDFHVVILGAGPELEMLEKYSINNPWLHLVGIQKGYKKALFYKISDIMLNPGLLGLHILDSFSIGIPLVSTGNARHSPEIAYLDNGVNGVLTADTIGAYSQAVLKLLSDHVFYKYVATNALKSGELYTLENMVDNFFEGIKKALG